MGCCSQSLLLPTGGKGSGIFDESTPVQTRQRLNPPGGKTSDIFGSPVTATAPSAHPNKPKVQAKSDNRQEAGKSEAELRALEGLRQEWCDVGDDGFLRGSL